MPIVDFYNFMAASDIKPLKGLPRADNLHFLERLLVSANNQQSRDKRLYSHLKDFTRSNSCRSLCNPLNQIKNKLTTDKLSDNKAGAE